MELYWKTAAGILLAVVLMLALGKQEIRLVLGIAVCTMAAMAAMVYLEPVLELLRSLEESAGLDGDMILILMKAVGIGLVTEIAGLVCADSGNASLGKVLQLLGTAVILWMSIPLFTALMELIRDILEGI